MTEPAPLPLDQLLEKLSWFVVADDPDELDRAFWPGEDGGSMLSACRDGMEALMYLARQKQVGWIVNAGWHCDVPFDQVHIEACDNKHRGCGFNAQIHARTPQGALAAGIIAVLEDRARRESAGAPEVSR